MTDRRFIGPGFDPWTVALFTAADPGSAIGSGVLIDRQRVLTCWHVVDGKRGGDASYARLGGPPRARDARWGGAAAVFPSRAVA